MDVEFNPEKHVHGKPCRICRGTIRFSRFDPYKQRAGDCVSCKRARKRRAYWANKKGKASKVNAA